jgi:two-component system OmpR family response regulator
MELKNILCIDDEADILEVAKLSLETIGGYTVKCCNSGMEGTKAVNTFHPDVILLDGMMPDLDGPATLKLLQENSLIKNIPVMFLTGKVQPEEIKHYISLGATGVITKPFDPMTLPKEVETLWRTFHDK